VCIKVLDRRWFDGRPVEAFIADGTQKSNKSRKQDGDTEDGKHAWKTSVGSLKESRHSVFLSRVAVVEVLKERTRGVIAASNCCESDYL
jgi:hypothetical protein